MPVTQQQTEGVLVYHEEFGPARLLQRVEGECTIELFTSPWTKREMVCPRAAIKRLALEEQTRVYFQRGNHWHVGRVLVGQRGRDGAYEYELQLPNRERETHNERDIFVRCWLPVADPTSALACGGTETQFFHERRLQISDVLIQQRAACRGLTGLLSAKVELIPHQVNVARRVLEDPLQRYLLADEVGMGKTIEAGFIARQYLVSDSTRHVLIVVPSSLVQQWLREMTEKFEVDQFAGRFEVLSYEQAESFPQAVDKQTLLIVDEAHHLVNETIPAWLDAWCRHADGLLLLSATPSLREPSVLLRLLKVLDPTSYSNVLLEEFSERIERQSDLGVFLRGLRADASPALVRQRLKRLPELFPDDAFVAECGNSIADSLGVEGGMKPLADSIAALRSHVADVYRIHHRLVRSRRRDCPDWVFRPRGRRPEGSGETDGHHMRSSWIEDSRAVACFELLEGWRVDSVACSAASELERRAYRDDYCRLFEAFACGFIVFCNEMELASDHVMSPATKQEFRKLLGHTQESDTPRAVSIATELKRHVTALQRAKPGLRPKLVLFSSSHLELDELASALRSLFDVSIAVDARAYGDQDNVAEKFVSNPDAFFLLCGPAHEEGLNLHFADALVHLDLPLSPQRIEQRIGRLDRFGRVHETVEQRVFLPSVDEETSPWEAWYELLAQGFQVFNVSIADVQFVLGKLVELAKDALFEHGASGVRTLVSMVRQAIESERQLLDDQYALDRVLQSEDEALTFFQNLEDIDAEESSVAAAVQNWLGTALQFRVVNSALNTNSYRWDQGRTQLPERPWRDIFRPGLDQPYTALRKVACSNKGEKSAHLLRLGNPLPDVIQKHLKWEDRGAAFATWRVDRDHNESLFFRLSYVVEASLPLGLSGAEMLTWRARMDGLLPPWQDVIYVDSELRAVLEQSTLDVLNRPYQKAAEGRGTDYNLSSRQDALSGVIDLLQFETLCRLVRTQSESMLLDSTVFKDRVATAVRQGEATLAQRIRRLRQRLTHTSDTAARAHLDREIGLSVESLGRLRKPAIRLDAIGVFVLSESPPVGADR